MAIFNSYVKLPEGTTSEYSNVTLKITMILGPSYSEEIRID